ncbi:MAG: hypothetical protein A2X59_08495 [Nitrospirae bacterium GWC2_42_7]|nr:MAG: hypothetical protein A2X59_08495 [Nitrospirae bacterium GWC2_42_7]
MLIFEMSEEQRRAGLLFRAVAKILDFILIAAVMEIIPKAGFFAGIAYILLSDGLFDGRSIGKKIIKLQVISSTDNMPCTFKDSILRNSTLAVGFGLSIVPWVGWIFFVIVLAFEFILILGSKEKKRLGDEIAKTLVLEN